MSRLSINKLTLGDQVGIVVLEQNLLGPSGYAASKNYFRISGPMNMSLT